MKRFSLLQISSLMCLVGAFGATAHAAEELRSESLRQMLCSKIAADHELSKDWATKTCKTDGKIEVAQSQFATYQGRKLTTRMKGSAKSASGTCAFSFVRAFPSAKVLENGSIQTYEPRWSVENTRCDFSRKLVDLNDIKYSDHSALSRVIYKTAYALTEAGNNDIDPAFNLGDGYYSCRAGQWFKVTDPVRGVIGIAWEGRCTYTEAMDPSEWSEYFLVYDLNGKVVNW